MFEASLCSLALAMGLLAGPSHALHLRDTMVVGVEAEAEVVMWDRLGQRRTFQSRRQAMEEGVLVGHFPDLDSCHSSCMAVAGCGHGQECLCNCCDIDGVENDGCFCYSCGPLGKPVTDYSQHDAVEQHSNPLSPLEEPQNCTGSKQMCGGMFGSTIRGDAEASTHESAAKSSELLRQLKIEEKKAAAEKEAREQEYAAREKALQAEKESLKKEEVEQMSKEELSQELHTKEDQVEDSQNELAMLRQENAKLKREAAKKSK